LATCIFILFNYCVNQDWVQESVLAWLWHHFHLALGSNPQPFDREPSALPLDHSFRYVTCHLNPCNFESFPIFHRLFIPDSKFPQNSLQNFWFSVRDLRLKIFRTSLWRTFRKWWRDWVRSRTFSIRTFLVRPFCSSGFRGWRSSVSKFPIRSWDCLLFGNKEENLLKL